tara:strand:+ start:24979 stop:25269 length:291 start_codon:yes stop_codon:yes gene_type:complete
MSYDWRALPQLKDKYVNNVFNAIEIGFPIKDASDHFITQIELFWFLRIDEDIASDMLLFSKYWKLEPLIRLSIELNNEAKWLAGHPDSKGYKSNYE